MTQTTTLTREQAINNLTTPTGRKFIFKSYMPNPSLLEVHYEDSKGGPLPMELRDHKFTSVRAGEIYLRQLLNKIWDDAEARTKK